MAYQAPIHTQVPNLLLDEHLPDMGYAECKVVLAIVRKTFGWHKKRDRLSISQLMDLTGLSNRSVINGIRAGMERGVIDRAAEGDSFTYWLVVDSEVSSQGGVKQVHKGSEVSSQEGVKQVHTQKKGFKETTTKERARAPEAAASPDKNPSTTPEQQQPASTQNNEPTLQRVLLHAKKAGVPAAVAEKFYWHYDAEGWKVNGRPLKRWQSKLQQWKVSQHKYSNGETTPDHSGTTLDFSTLL
jgi:phage replication O-like protein O